MGRSKGGKHMELLPCPECGKQPKLSSLDPMKYFCRNVHCTCGDWKSSEELVAADWNRREHEEEAAKIRVPLNRALYILLYDQFQSAVDMDLEMYDEQWVDYIVSALIEKNDDICPFKNYDCVKKCESSMEKCKDGLLITCDIEKESIWKKFMLI
ncbi:MAG: hypothetical protein ACOX4Q_12715 [Syntrophomonadales bacterium]